MLLCSNYYAEIKNTTTRHICILYLYGFFMCKTSNMHDM